MSKLLVSPSPHIHADVSTKSLMRDVVIALMPAVIASVVFYGWGELLVLGVSVASCVLLEYLITRYLLKKTSTVGDFSAVVTGLLLAMNLPATTPWWVVFIGAAFAICVAKLTFGGLGQNVFNPAIAGRVFLLVSFPTYMTHLMQGSTVPELMAQHGLSYTQMLYANLGGSAGEVCALALVAGFLYLLARKVVKPWITLSILCTVAILTTIFSMADPTRFTGPAFNLLSGGMLLGACFMATDYVTSPMSNLGGIIFGIGIGLLTVIIRYFGAYPEGMSFAILIMNATVPLLNRWFHQKKFGRA